MAAAAERRLPSANCTPRGNGSYTDTTQILMRTVPALVIHGGLAASTHALTRTRKREKKKKKGSGETVQHNR